MATRSRHKKMPATHTCARCGTIRQRSSLVYSRATSRYYCGPAFLTACDRRTKKRHQ